jgi:hypothetical protein
LPSGASAIGATSGPCITLKFGTKFKGGSICVKGVTPCGNTSNSCKNIVLITKAPNTPGNITGPSTLCPNQTATYSIAAIPTATSYSWSVPSNLQILSGQGSISVVVKALSNFNSGYVKVRASNCKDGSGTKAMTLIKSKGCRVSASSTKETMIVTEKLSGFNAYPNPTSGKLTLSFLAQSKSKCKLSVIDILGKTVLINMIEAIDGENIKDIDLSHVVKGMYFISIESEGLDLRAMRIIVD